MAFMGIIFVWIFLAIVALVVVCFAIAIILKILGKKKKSKGLKITGTIFIILGIVFSLPILPVVALILHSELRQKVTLPNGENIYISELKVSRMEDLATSGNAASIRKLEKLLESEPNLIYYLDINHKGLIDYGLENGNYDVVVTALKYGAKFDDENRYSHLSYIHNSMQSFINYVSERAVTSDDVEILELMFDANASTYYEDRVPTVYSNIFGKAAWAVLYNDEFVTDEEIEFMQVFIDHGLSTDDSLLLFEEKPYNIECHLDFEIVKDDNYYLLMEMIGK